MKQKLFMINIDKSGIELPIHAHSATKTMAFNQCTQRLDYIIQCQNELFCASDRRRRFHTFVYSGQGTGGVCGTVLLLEQNVIETPKIAKFLNKNLLLYLLHSQNVFSLVLFYLFFLSLFDTFFIIKFAVMCDFSDSPVWRNRRCDLAWKWQISWWIPLISFDNNCQIFLDYSWNGIILISGGWKRRRRRISFI